ncbi:hypothetical protein BD780_001800 [Clostridium tetanomorphum]|uniref:DUF4397 domain-containing protein n=1 Tax=Clostridium tetanomorphum TaxID=1553 RepID=UPI001FA920B8|nr:DUF4397 domain-containing protein [Clostridium tetanomorphum]MBP1864162.1 hypothetical protein [Clostridium tetanomorphum]NRS84575.1 hypothetical protein [Clostridium tetanomorphum]NRZ97789.1 hypothetical protein [Clostridium tetanomorphum]
MSYVRILHAVPKAPNVDVYLNDKLIAPDLAYKQFTEYLPLIPGYYNVKIYPAGNTSTPVINTNFSLENNKIITAAAIGTVENMYLKLIEDTPMDLPAGKTMIRFIHLSPNAPSVNVSLPNSSLSFNNVSFGQVTNYKEIPPGTYTVELRVSGTGNVVLTAPNMRLGPNKIYSIYAIGLAGDNPPLQILLPLDGNSYIKF